MEAAGLRGTNWKLVHSYLPNRTQMVKKMRDINTVTVVLNHSTILSLNEEYLVQFSLIYKVIFQ